MGGKIMQLNNEQQLFYSLDGSEWIPSLNGSRWPDDECEGYLYKHLTWVEFQDIVNPTKSNDELFSEEMEQLNNQYDIDMLVLANEYNIAVARDASTETEKVLTARAKIDALDAKYESDQASLIEKYKEA